MFLKRLEIYGFKSFGTKSVLDFENEKIAGVVGPNGSGKSNVADAIRWVLGEQSTNLLRSKKGEDVVFVGSAKRARSSYVEVSLLLTGDKEVEVEIAGKKHKFNNIEITRKLYRSGEGEYLINRKKVRLLDLQTLLASLGFGQSSYTVIGQGMVDRLLFFNAAERRVLFDEAAGVKQYKIKRGQAIKRLETTEENLIRLKDINQELTPRVQNLRRLVKKAEGRLATEKELAESENKYYGSVLSELADNIAKLNLKKEGFLAKIKYLENEKETAGKAEVSDNKNLAEKQSRLEKEQAVLSEKRDQSLKEIAFIEGQIREQENIYHNLKNNQVSLVREENRLEEEIDKLKSELKDKTAKVAAAQQDISMLESEIDKIQQDLKNYARETSGENKAQVEKLTEEKAVIERELNRFEEAERLQRTMAKDSEDRKLKLAQEVVELKNRLKEKEAGFAKESVNAKRVNGEIVKIGKEAENSLFEVNKIEKEILANRERVNPENIESFKKEIGKLKEVHRIFSGHVSSGSKELKAHFDTFSKQFDKIIKLTHQFSEAIDPELREILEHSLAESREKYFQAQNRLSEKNKEAEKTKHALALFEHEINHLKAMIGEKTSAGERIQLAAKSFVSEIKAAKDQLGKVSDLLDKTKDLADKENEKLENERQALSKKIEQLRNGLYEAKLKEAQAESRIRELKRGLEHSESALIETKALLAKAKEEKFDHNLEGKLKESKDSLIKLEKEIETVRNALTDATNEVNAFSETAIRKERAVYELEKQEAQVKDQINEIELEKAKYETKSEAVKEEMRLFNVTVTGHFTNIDQSEKDILRARIENLRRKKDSIASLDPETLAEYEESEQRLGELSGQLDDLEKAKDDLEKLIKELDRKISSQFSYTFHSIGERFQKYFALLFDGGKATLTLDQDEESGELGIEITANPPGKKVQSLSMLSGGERTLTSLALVFAILSINPSPFCVLDEVDAALDEANTLRFVKILKDLDKKTQFIVITHNRETMKVANYLYGLTMNEEHISKLFSVKLAEAYEAVK